MKKYLLLVLFISCLSGALAQHSNWTAQLSASGIYASNDVNPFWFTANTNGQFGNQTSFSLLGEVTGEDLLGPCPPSQPRLPSSSLPHAAAAVRKDAAIHPCFQPRSHRLQAAGSRPALFWDRWG